MSTPVFLSVTEAAMRLGRNARVVRLWCENGTLPAQRVGRAWVIAESDLALVAGMERRRRTKAPDK